MRKCWRRRPPVVLGMAPARLETSLLTRISSCSPGQIADSASIWTHHNAFEYSSPPLGAPLRRGKMPLPKSGSSSGSPRTPTRTSNSPSLAPLLENDQYLDADEERSVRRRSRAASRAVQVVPLVSKCHRRHPRPNLSHPHPLSSPVLSSPFSSSSIGGRSPAPPASSSYGRPARWRVLWS